MKKTSKISTVGIFNLIIITIFFGAVWTSFGMGYKRGVSEKQLEFDEVNRQLEIEINTREFYQRFARDQPCRIRGYEYYTDKNGNGYCCQWFNQTKVCNDWLSVMHENAVTVKFTTFEHPDADILIDSIKFGDDIEEMTIYINGFPGRKCRIWDGEKEEAITKIVCYK